MVSPDHGGLVHAMAYCVDCDFEVGTKNSMGLAAQHAEANPSHTVHCETGHSYIWEGDS